MESKLEKLIFEKSVPGRKGVNVPASFLPEKKNLLPEGFLRKEAPALPECSELDVVRHYTRLSTLNYGVDYGFYPLGSCTMKYNPKVNEVVARLDGFANLHPYQEEKYAQGALELMYNLQEDLCKISGMDSFTLQPAAGAHGEFTGILMVKAFHESRGEKRTKVLVPDSAHGTNPASAAMAGFEIVTIKSNDKGLVDLDSLRAALAENQKEVAALMLTNPNTLGLFEEEIKTIAELVHGVGGLLYYDGANLNAIMGVVRPGDMGFDVLHINLHKTFAGPHGGGGPGSGPVGVKKFLAEFLPVPTVVKKNESFSLNYDLPRSIGKMKAFYGNFSVLVRAYAYILSMGASLKQASMDAVLSANYIKSKLEKEFDVPYPQTCMHEFVICGDRQKAKGASTLNMAKRLIDLGYHPPTVYFPLVVHEAMMIEPTETESKETLDAFIEAMKQINREIDSDLEKVTSAPQNAPIGKVDEVAAARKPNFRWRP
ncbi:MAG TPA: aminomethyl-transferring glycine dehydrogenase subunit GcvPB [Chroococcales cyanobacterium]